MENISLTLYIYFLLLKLNLLLFLKKINFIFYNILLFIENNIIL